MSTLRVNLLKESEYRYQGPVSMRFVMLICGSLLGAVVLLLAAVSIQQSLALRSNLRLAKQEWESIEARYNSVVEKQKELATHLSLLRELQTWHTNRPEWSRLLPALQDIAPESVQLTRLGMRSDWVYLKPPAPPEGAKSGDENKEAKNPPLIPARKTTISAEGRARGELADETVVQFVRTWRDNAAFKPYFESVRLQRLQRESDRGSGGGDDRLFEIQGEFALRKLE